MTTDFWRVPLRTDIYDRESLASYSFRTGIRNYGVDYTFINKLCRAMAHEPRVKETWKYLSSGETFEDISRLLWLNEMQLYNATIHPLAAFFNSYFHELTYIQLFSTPAKLPILVGHNYQRHVRLEAKSAVCPCCNRVHPYHKVDWIPSLISVCLEHNCLLLNKCHSCGADFRAQDIVLNKCHNCGDALSNGPIIDMSHDEFGMNAQHTTWNLLFAESSGQYFPIPELSRRAAYQTIYGLSSFLRLHNKNNLSLGSVYNAAPIDGMKATKDSYQSYLYTAASFKALVDWPHGFFRFLDDYKTNVPLGSKTPRRELGSLYTTWLAKQWAYPDFKIIQIAFHKYFMENYAMLTNVNLSTYYSRNREIVDGYEYLNIKQAAKSLGCSSRYIKHMTITGVIKLHEISDSSQKWILRQDINEIKIKWERSITLKQINDEFGINYQMIRSLVDIGMINRLRGPEIDGSSKAVFDKLEVESLVNGIRKNTYLVSSQDGLFNIKGSIHLLGALHMNVPKLFHAVSIGSLKACYLGTDRLDEKFLLSNIRFRRSDITQYIAKVIQEEGWVRIKEAYPILRIRLNLFRRWVNAGLITPVAVLASTMYFDKNELEAFAQNHLFSAEVAELLEVSLGTVQEWARRGRLKPIWRGKKNEHFLFERSGLENYLPEYRISALELAKLWGLSEPYVYKLIHQGKIKPISGPGIDSFETNLFSLRVLERIPKP